MGQQHIAGRASALPFRLIGQAIPMLSRHDLEELTAHLIDCLDEIDGNPDAEEDDHAGECSEDEISCGPGNWGGLLYRGEPGPGCEISDPGGLEI